MPIKFTGFQAGTPDNGGQAQSGGQIINDSGTSFNDLYNQIVNMNDANGNSLFQEKREDAGPQDAGTREMSQVERVLKGMQELGENVMKPFDFGGSVSGALQNPAKFAASIPAGMVSGALQAPSELAEAATGNRITEADLGSNQISNDQLDTNERAGAGVVGAIDAFGPFAGGSARMLQGAANLGKRASNEVLGTAFDLKPAQSFIERAGIGGKAAGVVGDMAEEAGEEAVQSLAQDVRDDQFSIDSWARAGESAVLGAAGGGLASAAGRGMSRLAGASSEPQATVGNISTQNMQDTTAPASYFRNQSQGVNAEVDDLVYQDFVDKQDKQQAQNTANGRATATQGGWDLGWNQIDVGVPSLVRGWQSDAKNQDEFAAASDGVFDPAFVKQLTSDFTNGDLTYDQVAKQLNDQMQTAGKSIEMGSWRDPATKKSSRAKFTVRRFHGGNSIQMNPAVYQQFGADLDGDQFSFTSDRGILDQMKWATSYMMGDRVTPDGRDINVDDGYLGIDLVGKDSKKKLMAVVDKVVQDPATRGTFKHGLERLYANKDNAANFRDFIAFVSSNMEQMNAENPGSGDALTSQMLSQMQQATRIDLSIRNAVEQAVQEKAAGRDFQDYSRDKDLSPYLNRNGRRSKETVAWAQIVDVTHKIVQSMTFTENPAIRNAQSAYWSATHVRDFGENNMLMRPDDSVDTMIAVMMKLKDQELHPQDAIEGTFRAYVVSGVYNQANLGAYRIGDGISAEQFQRIFIDTYNDVAKRFNAVIKDETYDGLIEPIESVSRQEVSGPSSYARAFRSVFGGYAMREVFSMNDGNRYAGYTLDQYLDTTAGKYGMSADARVDNSIDMGKDVNDLLRSLVMDRGRQQAGKGTRLQRDIKESWAPMLRQSRGKAQERMAETAYFRAIVKVVGVEACVRNGLFSVDHAKASSYGKYLFGSYDPDKMASAIGSLSMYNKWGGYIEAKLAGDEDLAKRHVLANIGISDLDNLVASEILHDGSDNLLKHLIDPGDASSFEAKEAEFAKMMKERKPDIAVTPSLMEQMIRQEDSMLGDGTLTNGIKDANAYMRRAKNNHLENLREELKKVDGMVRDGDVNAAQLASAITTQLRDSDLNVIANIDIAAAQCFDSAFITKQKLDKGKSDESADLNYSQLSLIEEGTAPRNVIERIVSGDQGTMSPEQMMQARSHILKAIADPDFHEQVVFPKDDVIEFLDQKTIFGWVDEVIVDGNPTWTQYRKLFDAYPALVSMVPDVVVQPSAVAEDGGQTTTLARNGSFAAFAKNAKDYAGDQARQRSNVHNFVRKEMVRSAKLNTIILGNVVKNNQGNSANLLGNAKFFHDEYVKAFGRIENLLVRATSEQTTDDLYKKFDGKMSKALIDSEFETFVKQTSDTVNGLIERMSRTGFDATGDYVADVVNRVGQATICNQVLADMGIGGNIDATNVAKMPEGVNRTFTDRIMDYSAEAVDVLTAMSFDSYAYPKSLDGLDPDIETTFKDAIADKYPGITDAEIDKRIAEATQHVVGNASGEYSKLVINPSLVYADAGNWSDLLIEAVKKIENSGLIGPVRGKSEFSKKTTKEIQKYLDAAKAARKDNDGKTAVRMESRWKAEIERVCNRYNAKLLAECMSQATAFGKHRGYHYQGISKSMEAIQELNELRNRISDSMIAGNVQNKEPGLDADLRDVADLFDFSETWAAFTSDQAASSQDGAGNSILAGVGGGAFKDNTILAALWGANTDKGISEQRTVAEIEASLGDPFSRYNMCSYEGQDGVQHQLTSEILDKMNPDDVLKVYPIDLSSNGVDRNVVHLCKPGMEDQLPLASLMSDMGYYMSENGVFKRKKVAGKFDVAFRRIEGMNGDRFVKTFAGMDRDAAMRQVAAWRTQLAKDYYAEIIKEDMQGSFGETDMMMLAQATTPVMVVELPSGAKRTVSAHVLFDDAAYDSAEIDGMKVSDLFASGAKVQLSVIPFNMVAQRAVNTLMRNQEVVDRFGKGAQEIDRSKLGEIAYDAWTDWSGFHVSDEQLSKAFTRINPLSRSYNPSIVTARNASNAQLASGIARLSDGNFIRLESALDEANMTDKEYQQCERATDGLMSKDDAKKYLIVAANRDADRDRATPDLSYVDRSPKYNKVGDRRFAYVMSGEDARNSASVRNMFDQLRDKPGYVLFLEKSVSGIGRSALSASENQVVDNVAVGGREYLVFDPFTMQDDFRPALAVSYKEVRDGDIAFMVADHGGAMGGDSPIGIYPEANNKLMRVRSNVDVKLSTLFNRSGSDFVRASMTIADVDAVEDAFNANDPALCYPSIQGMTKQYIDNKIKRYLARDRSTFDANGYVDPSKERVEIGDVIGWVKAESTVDGRDAYAPIIITGGGLASTISKFDVDDLNRVGDTLSIAVEGEIKPSEVDAWKGVFKETAYKGMVTVLTDDQVEALPVMATGDAIDGKDVAFTHTYSAATDASRLVDWDENIPEMNLYYYSINTDYSMFQKRDNGKWVPDYAKFENLQNPNKVTKDDVDLLMRGNPTAWRQIIDGTKVMTDDPELQVIHALVAQACRDYKFPPEFLFSSLDVDGGVRRVMCDQYSALFTYLNHDQVLRFWHSIDQELCPDGIKDASDRAYKFNALGQIRTEIFEEGGESHYSYSDCKIQPDLIKAIATNLGMPSNGSRFGNQQFVNRAIDNGLDPADVGHFLDMLAVRSKQSNLMETDRLTKIIVNDELDDDNGLQATPWITNAHDAAELIQPIANAMDAALTERISALSRQTWTKLMNITDGDGKPLNKLGDSDDARRYRAATQNLWNALKAHGQVNELMVHALFKAETGFGYNEGRGTVDVDVNTYERYVQQIADRVTKGKAFPIEGGLKSDGRRVAVIPPRSVIEWLYNDCDAINQAHAREKFDDMMEEEMRKTKDAISEIPVQDRAKRTALGYLVSDHYRSFGRPEASDVIMGEHTVSDLKRNRFQLLEAYGSADPTLRTAEEYEQDHLDQMIKNMRRKEEQRRQIETKTATAIGKSSHRLDGNTGFRKGMKILINLKMTNSVLNPALPISAIVDAYKGNGLMKAGLYLHRNVPFIGDAQPFVIKNREALKAAGKDADVRFIWVAMNNMRFSISDMNELNLAKNMAEIKEMLERKAKSENKLDTITRKVLRIASGGNASVGMQIENFFDYFAQNADQSLDPLLWEPSEGDVGKTRFEALLEQDPAKLMTSLLTVGKDQNNTSLRTAMMAKNHVAMTTKTQETIQGIFLSELFERCPASELFSKAFISTFPHYTINITNYVLQFIAPVSTLNYVFTEKFGDGKLMGVDLAAANAKDRARVFPSLKAAVIKDAASLGCTAIGMMLASLLPFDPPDDEDKWGNLNEWKFFGLPIGEAWWLMDIIGPAFAIGATAKSAAMGKLRFDILSNWFAQALWNNPMLAITDVVEALMSIENPYEKDIVNSSRYQKCEDGKPTAAEWLAWSSLSYGLNTMSKFVTPSIVRDLYQNWPGMDEKSTSKVYALDQHGRRIQDEETGSWQTVETTYGDRKMREMCRNNPMWAVIFDMMNGINPLSNDDGTGKTGYLKYQMPSAVFYEEPQLYYMNRYSDYDIDEQGQRVERSYTEMDKQAVEIITILQNTNDIGSLVEHGFCMPSAMREYVSKVIHDNLKALDNQYNEWVNEYGMDAYALGNGDWAAGKTISNNTYKAYSDTKSALWDVYNKLWSDELKDAFQVYNRYETTYQQDANGEWYASGYQRNGLASILQPLGLTYDRPDQDTAKILGKAKDWDTRSNIGDYSTGQRALHPIDKVYVKTPSMDSWDSDSNGYSDIYRSGATTAGTTTGSATPSSSKKTATRKYPSYGSRSYSSGGRGYSRRSGGSGGGGGSKTIYSRLPSINMNSARTMDTTKLNDANYDYLRPGFETKGSREAYKRSDI